MTVIRERPPLQLDIHVRTPAGQVGRWAGDAPHAENVYSGLTFSSVMPGGHEQFGCTLSRDPARDYYDLEELTNIDVLGPGGEMAWQGRLESLPDVGGDQQAVNPAGVGYQSHLDDNNAAREIIVERNISNWRGPSIQRQIKQLQLASPANVNGPSVGPDAATPTTQPLPSLVTEIDGSWTALQAAEAWYDPSGVYIDDFYAAWEANPVTSLSSPGFYVQMGLGQNDSDDPITLSAPLTATPGSHTIGGGPSFNAFPLARLINSNASGGADGVNYQVFWTVLALYGHPAAVIPRVGSYTQYDAPGVLASDIIRYLISQWCPLINFDGVSIQASTFVIDQFSFPNPGTVSAMVKEATKYELLDWAIWDGPKLWVNARNAVGRKWRARMGPANLQDAGPQISRTWNGVIVTYNDVSGVVKTVGPPGSGANYEDASLLDTNPDNPVNQIQLTSDVFYSRVTSGSGGHPGGLPGGSLKRWALVTMGLSTQSAAVQVGAIFLQEQKKLNQAGQASLVGHVQDENGIWWPAWMVRAGDQISFMDASDIGYRRIVHASYDDSSKTCTIQLDQPPDSLQAILERLNIVLQPYGL